MNRFIQNRTLALFTLLASTLSTWAQVAEVAIPKWGSKVQKSILSLIAYDQNHEMIHEGTAAFVTDNGIAVADYALLRDAYSAVVVTVDGKQMEVTRILGADESYGVVKMQVNAKKTTPLSFTPSSGGTSGSRTFAVVYQKGKLSTCPSMPIAKKDIVEEQYAYYTLQTAFDAKYTGAMLFDEQGDCLGIVQSPMSGHSYAIDATYARHLSVSAIQSKSAMLSFDKIHIRKGLPDSKEEALVYLYFKSKSADNDEYLDLLNLFVDTYPDVAEGYLRRVTPLMDLHRFDEADRDLKTYLKLAADQMAAHANVADALYNKLRFLPEEPYEAWTYDLALEHMDKALKMAQDGVAGAKDEETRTAADNTLLQYQLQKALILSGKGDYQAAIDIYDDLNAGPHRSPSIYYAASMAHEAKGDSVSVQIALMDSALVLFPDPMPADAANYVMHRGQLLALAGRYREAVADYNKYCYLNNNRVTADFYYDRFLLEKQARMYQQALDDIDAAIGQSPREPLYYVERSALQLMVNQIDECIASARQCLAIDPENSDAYRIMGYAQIQKGEKTEALKNLQRAIELGDPNAQEIIDKYLK